MFEYLVENREWIFSGIGVFLLAGVVSIAISVLHKKKGKPSKIQKISREQKSYENDEDVSFISSVEPSNITVKAIIDEINNAPPFQRDTIGPNYHGINVQWKGTLWEVEKMHSATKTTQNVRVVLHLIPENLHYRVLFNANIKKYPNLKIARRDDLIAVEGKIIKCSGQGMYVELEVSNLKFISAHNKSLKHDALEPRAS